MVMMSATVPALPNEREALLTLCHELQDAGIWLYLDQEDALIAGPPPLLHEHPVLLDRLREQKSVLIRLLQDCLVMDIFCAGREDARFAREICPECQRSCLIIQPRRRLEAHRLPDGQTVCPGSERAQHATAHTIMQAFVVDRCVQRPQSVLTWYGVRGALTAWCRDRAWLLPPRLYIVAWLDSHYRRLGDNDELLRWAGLTLTIEEWLGDENTSLKKAG
jgi:hypothetical protein